MDFGTILLLIEQYRYAFLIPGALFFGPIVNLTAGVLIRFGTLDLVPTVACLAFTELAGDIFLYWAGYHWGERFVSRFGSWVGITGEHIEAFKRLYHRYHDWIIFSSKITAGFGFAPTIYFSAGMARVPFRRYMVFNIVGQAIWTTAMLSIGYYLGESYISVNNLAGRMSIAATVIVAFVAFAFTGRYILRRILTKNSV